MPRRRRRSPRAAPLRLPRAALGAAAWLLPVRRRCWRRRARARPGRRGGGARAGSDVAVGRVSVPVRRRAGAARGPPGNGPNGLPGSRSAAIACGGLLRRRGSTRVSSRGVQRGGGCGGGHRQRRAEGRRAPCRSRELGGLRPACAGPGSPSGPARGQAQVPRAGASCAEPGGSTHPIVRPVAVLP